MNASKLASAAVEWKPLSILHPQFTANAAALAERHPALAQRLSAFTPVHQHVIRAAENGAVLGRRLGAGVEEIPEQASDAVAAGAVKQLCPDHVLALPTLVAGIDRGWLWQRLHALPCAVPAAPGHRPPLFFLERHMDRFWAALHLHDWRKMLADPRVRLFVGEDAFGQFRDSLIQQVTIPWPRQSITVDHGLWPQGQSLERVLADTTLAAAKLIDENRRAMADRYAGRSAADIAAQLRAGTPLRVLGITSRYTTFLQYSMRDWLAAFDRLGHTTQLLIESADHEHSGPIHPGQVCREFQPDLILIIDHFRRAFPCLPTQVPCVMWVQDQLPHIFSPNAGASQDVLDYCLGFARLQMIHEFHYPPARYMSARVGVDETRYCPRKLNESERSALGCEVSFVSHASTPAEKIVRDEADRQSVPAARVMLHGVFDRLSAIYAAGVAVTGEPALAEMIDHTAAEHRLAPSAEAKAGLLLFFNQRVNNALFRHQALHWLAEMGIDLRLWGRGWESHPALSRYARGPADNQTQLAAIYQASRINLHMSPHGAVHQRIFEGLAAGGFFMIRHCPGDELERHFRKILAWCDASGVICDTELRRCATPAIRREISVVTQLLQADPFAPGSPGLMDVMRASEQSGYIESAGAIWGADYDAVAFKTRDELAKKVRRYLADEPDRQQTSDRMRRPVLERFTYSAVSRRLLSFMAADLARSSQARAAA